jgi:hypothetical protein
LQAPLFDWTTEGERQLAALATATPASVLSELTHISLFNVHAVLS